MGRMPQVNSPVAAHATITGGEGGELRDAEGTVAADNFLQIPSQHPTPPTILSNQSSSRIGE